MLINLSFAKFLKSVLYTSNTKRFKNETPEIRVFEGYSSLGNSKLFKGKRIFSSEVG